MVPSIPLVVADISQYVKNRYSVVNPFCGESQFAPIDQESTMLTNPSYSECRGYVAAHLLEGPDSTAVQTKRLPSLTISRQAGAHGRTIGLKLQEALRNQDSRSEIPWTLFDDNLVQQVQKYHQGGRCRPASLHKTTLQLRHRRPHTLRHGVEHRSSR